MNESSTHRLSLGLPPSLSLSISQEIFLAEESRSKRSLSLSLSLFARPTTDRPRPKNAPPICPGRTTHKNTMNKWNRIKIDLTSWIMVIIYEMKWLHWWNLPVYYSTAVLPATVLYPSPTDTIVPRRLLPCSLTCNDNKDRNGFIRRAYLYRKKIESTPCSRICVQVSKLCVDFSAHGATHIAILCFRDTVMYDSTRRVQERYHSFSKEGDPIHLSIYPSIAYDDHQDFFPGLHQGFEERAIGLMISKERERVCTYRGIFHREGVVFLFRLSTVPRVVEFGTCVKETFILLARE